MLKSTLLGLGLALGLTAPALAAEIEDHLPKSLERVISKDTDGAIQRFTEIMLDLHPEGVITHEVLDNYRKYLIAKSRSEKLQQIMAFDLDFDGNLSESELAYARSVPQKRGWLRRPQLELMILDGDLDADQTLDWDEIRSHVIRSTDTDLNSRLGRQTAFIFDILVLDIDGDGALTIPEMAKALRELRKN